MASFVLTYDKIQVLQNPSYVPACNINPIFSCGSVMKTEQASLLGVPNTIFGLLGFTALATFAVLLLSGAKFKKWIWQAAQLASVAGVIFMHYLFYQGVFRIGAICPWCFATWMVTIPIFLYVTVYNLQEKNFKLPKFLMPVTDFVTKYHLEILITWYLLIFAILLEHFWYFWKTLV